MTERRAKQVLVVRKDLGMRKGKIAAQCAHASLKVLLDLMDRASEEISSEDPSLDRDYTILTARYEKQSALGRWLDGTFTKICVSVNSEAELVEIYEKARAAHLLASLIIDNGYTEFHGVPTKTVVALGPAWDDELDPITGSLPLL